MRNVIRRWCAVGAITGVGLAAVLLYVAHTAPTASNVEACIRNTAAVYELTECLKGKLNELPTASPALSQEDCRDLVEARKQDVVWRSSAPEACEPLSSFVYYRYSAFASMGSYLCGDDDFEMILVIASEDGSIVGHLR